MKTITFYSYKGGVGRSLSLANVAMRLCEFERTVCLLDFDLEAPGLHYKFSSVKPFTIKKGIVDYIYEFTNTGILPDNILEYSIPIPIANGHKPAYLIPAGNINSRDYWKKLSAINWFNLLYENKHGITFLLDLKEKIRNQLQPQYLLIDSRTGVSEMSGIALSLLGEKIVVVSANNRENLNGSKRIIQSILNSRNTILEESQKVFFVLSRIPFTDNASDKIREQNLISKIKKVDLENLINDITVIHSDRDLELDEQIKIGFDNEGATAQISKDYLSLFEKLTHEEFTEEEIKKFQSIKKSELLITKAAATTSVAERIELINQAINVNPNTFFYYYRAIAHAEQLNFASAIEDCIHVISKIKFSPANHLLAQLYIDTKKYGQAEEIYSELIQTNSKDYYALLGLSIVCYELGNYDQTIELCSRAIEVNPEEPNAYNGRASAKRLQGKYKEATDDVYKALELNPNHAYALCTLAEINAAMGKINEFYLYLEMALKMEAKGIERSILAEPIYEKFVNDERFQQILERYNIVYPLIIHKNS